MSAVFARGASCMSAVFKYAVQPRLAPTTIAMPFGAKIIHVGQQNNVPMLWALVDPNADLTETRDFFASPTGTVVPDRSTYLGTAHLYGGDIVAHIFEAYR